MSKVKDLYDDGYFESRKKNDPSRIKSFLQEKSYIENYINLDGRVCDIGCSTGEFLDTIGWRGPRYGMEINQVAKKTAASSGISFEKNVLTVENYFDVVIYRGTIQHLPDPFTYLEKTYTSLKKGGVVLFLATPNANSIVYKLFNTLPALDPAFNFYIPSDITLSSILGHYGFEVLSVQFPYIDSPYAKFLSDHLSFIKNLITKEKPTYAFWKNMMNLVAIK